MNISRPGLHKLLAAAFVLTFSITVGAQVRKRNAANRPAPSVEAPSPTPPPVSPKKNERPAAGNGSLAARSTNTPAAKLPAYHYEFSQPDFTVSKVVIAHDENGNGTVSFQKKDFDEMVSDPIVVSAEALARINGALTALDFVNSAESYQYEKPYPHLGTIKIRIKKGAKERETEFNWTTNKDAKIVSDEYRKIGNQYIWMFDITVARENQPLNAPRLLDELDSLYKRKELSDPKQMIPLLRGLGDDERIPLIARNHAVKLVEEIQNTKN